MDRWTIAAYIYGSAVGISFWPVLRSILAPIRLDDGGLSFDKSPHFDADSKELLEQHYTRMQGTLKFWKKRATQYRRFHLYCLIWTIPSAVVLPAITMAISGSNASRFFATLVSGVTAVLLAFHRGFKVEDNYKSFRHGESEFYDLYRRLLDRPTTLGQSRQEQLDAYFREVEVIRRFVRNAETDNLATLDEARTKLSANTLATKP